MPRAIATAVILLLAVTGAAEAVDRVNAEGRDRVAIHGYDAVAYFADGEAREGSAEHRFAWNGATWWFATAEHRDAFAADPGRYAPQYGGYCAYAMSRGETVDVDPEAWSIVDGKLYLNYSKRIRAKWEKSVAEYVSQADSAWSTLLESE